MTAIVRGLTVAGAGVCTNTTAPLMAVPSDPITLPEMDWLAASACVNG